MPDTKAYEMFFLDPRKTHFTRTEGDLLRVKVDGVGDFPKIKLYRAFPLSHRDQYISVRDATDKREPEIGIIEELNELTADDRTLIEAELRARYFIPRITKINSVTDTYDILEWDVDTDRGHRRFSVKDVHDRMRLIGEDHFIISDTEDCRYAITNLKEFPATEQRLVLRHFYR